jgi:glycosyltransferase involved in cell wall biosynthesis
MPFDHIHAKAAEAVEHPFFKPASPPVFLGVGRLTAQKDFANLIRAFAIVRARMPARLVILGTGDLLGALQQLARMLAVQGDVCFAGFVANPYAYMARSAALVVSSRFEGLSTVLIEGLASGTRIVSTDCPSGPREILEHGRFGALVPVGDPAALAKAMLQSAVDATGPVGVAESLERFQIDRIIGQYLDVLAPASRKVAWKEAA